MIANFTNSYIMCQRKLNIMGPIRNNSDKTCISVSEFFNRISMICSYFVYCVLRTSAMLNNIPSFLLILKPFEPKTNE